MSISVQIPGHGTCTVEKDHQRTCGNCTFSREMEMRLFKFTFLSPCHRDIRREFGWRIFGWVSNEFFNDPLTSLLKVLVLYIKGEGILCRGYWGHYENRQEPLFDCWGEEGKTTYFVAFLFHVRLPLVFVSSLFTKNFFKSFINLGLFTFILGRGDRGPQPRDQKRHDGLQTHTSTPVYPPFRGRQS